MSRNNQKLTTAQFIDRAIKKHGNRYDYSMSVYEHSDKKISIKCQTHGYFLQRPGHHINIGQGCPKCAAESTAKIQRSSKESFIERAREVHEDKYQYDKVEYIQARKKVIITCPEHGDFEQTPNNHVVNKQDCPKCFCTGYDVTRPGTVYIIKYAEFFKVGITNNFKNRFGALKTRNYSHTPISHTVRDFENGQAALNFERKVKLLFEHKFMSKEEFPDGHTETFSLNHHQTIVSLLEQFNDTKVVD